MENNINWSWCNWVGLRLGQVDSIFPNEQLWIWFENLNLPGNVGFHVPVLPLSAYDVELSSYSVEMEIWLLLITKQGYI